MLSYRLQRRLSDNFFVLFAQQASISHSKFTPSQFSLFPQFYADHQMSNISTDVHQYRGCHPHELRNLGLLIYPVKWCSPGWFPDRSASSTKRQYWSPSYRKISSQTPFGQFFATGFRWGINFDWSCFYGHNQSLDPVILREAQKPISDGFRFPKVHRSHETFSVDIVYSWYWAFSIVARQKSLWICQMKSERRYWDFTVFIPVVEWRRKWTAQKLYL
jgi:hypothetical protein